MTTTTTTTTDPSAHVNVLINASVSEPSCLLGAEEDDDRRLLGRSPRNNFPSYSNEGVSVRFRVSVCQVSSAKTQQRVLAR